MAVNIHQSARDLKALAFIRVENPTLGKRIRHSRALSPFRRKVQKGARTAGVVKLVGTGIGEAIKHIPVPVVGSLTGKAWSWFQGKIREHHIKSRIETPVRPDDRVKFSLKAIGDQVSSLDRYRWKIEKATRNLHETAQAVLGPKFEGRPCDTWVHVWRKHYYLGSRIRKMRQTVFAAQAVLKEAEEWLEDVEKGYHQSHQVLHARYRDDVQKLKRFAGAHDQCAEDACMFKSGSYTARMSVPTSKVANFFVQAAGEITSSIDPIGDTHDETTSILDD